MPPHYAKVVTEEQREKIYSIQAEYRTKIETARAQLDALVKEEKDKISAVLNEEQKKKLEKQQQQINHELETAGEIQKSLLPDSDLEIDNIVIA